MRWSKNPRARPSGQSEQHISETFARGALESQEHDSEQSDEHAVYACLMSKYTFLVLKLEYYHGSVTLGVLRT